MCDCADAVRWGRAWLRFGHRALRYHFESQRKILGCLACGSLRLPEEVYYCCGLCDDWELCELCYLKGVKSHQHRLFRERTCLIRDMSSLSGARCTAEAMAMAFKLHGERPCLGWRARCGSGRFSDEYSWLSYKETGQAVEEFGSGLESLRVRADCLPGSSGDTPTDSIGTTMFVGVLGAVCVQWLVTDYACVVVKLLPSSGSTGLPKLVAVTEATLWSGASLSAKRTPSAAPSAPIVFAYEAMRQSHDVLVQGGSIGFFSGSLDRLLDDVRCLRPTVFAATPMFWNGLFSQYEAEQRRRGGIDAHELLAEWHERKLLGNRIAVVISTGAPLSPHVQRWVTRVFMRTIINGYGTTETGGLSSNGAVSDGVQLRLRDVPAMGYLTSDLPHPRGEILARTPRMAGYYDRERLRADGSLADASAVGDSGESGLEEDEWITLGGERYFRTGDIGELTGPGQVRVIDRCKSHFKLAQGLFVAPELVEAVLRRSPYVFQVFVWGSGHMHAVAAVVVPSDELLSVLSNAGAGAGEVLEGCSETCPPGGLRSDEILARSEACGDPRAHEVVMRSVQAVSVEQGLNAWEVPQFLKLEATPFSDSNGLLTSMGKPCRPMLIAKYRREICPEHDEESPSQPPQQLDNGAGDSSGLCAGLREVLIEVAGGVQPHGAALTSHSTLLSLGLDSMRIARLSSRLAERFGVTILPKVLFALPTLAHLEAVVFGGDAAARRVVLRTSAHDWQGEAEAVLADADLDVATGPGASAASGGDDNKAGKSRGGDVDRDGGSSVLLLTGATGFLGAFLVRALLQAAPLGRGTQLMCVVRAANDAEASQRLRRSLVAYGLTDDDAVQRWLVAPGCVVAGDVTVARLGLAMATYAALVPRLRCVVHCAAVVSAALPFEALRSPNVVGTRHALQLATAAGADYVHVSTLGFLDPGAAESLQVETCGLPARSGYAQSKYVAELVVAGAVIRPWWRGGRVLVVRPGVLCGDSASGASNEKDALSMLLCGMLLERATCTVDPRSPLPQLHNLLPVDAAAAAIASLIDPASTGSSTSMHTEPTVYHLSAPTSQQLSTLVEWARAAGHPLEELSAEEFCRRARAVTEGHALFALKMMLTRPSPSPVAKSASVEPRARLEAAAFGGHPRELTPKGLALAIDYLLPRWRERMATPAV